MMARANIMIATLLRCKGTPKHATLFRPLLLIAMSRSWAREKEATECGCAAEMAGQRFAGDPGTSLQPVESQSLGNKSCMGY